MKHALVFAALAASVTAQAPTWANITFTGTALPAAARRSGAMAFDSVSNKLIAYGGISVSPSAILNQTSSYGPSPTALSWTTLAPSGNPPARWGHRMVRNSVNGHLITFGGRSPNFGSFANDTWEYTGSLTTGGTWTQTPIVAPNPKPSARYLYGLAYDDVRHVAILFGGSSATATFNDTWEYDGAAWTQVPIPLAERPPVREDMVLVYDPTLNRTVMFGGFDPNTGALLGDTWLYNGTSWTLQIPQAITTPVPTPRYSANAVYDSVRRRIVMFGGFDNSVPSPYSQQTFQFAGDSWQLIAGATPLPPCSTQAYSGYDPVRRKFVLQGGFGGTFTGQTWELNVPATGNGQPGMFGAFAQGCSVLSPALTISGTVPTIGQTMTTTIGQLNVTPGLLDVFVVHVLGTSNQTSGGLPLPLDLTAIGLTSCSLYVSADFIDAALAITPQPPAAPIPLPTVAFGLPIPNNATFVNAVFYSQAFSLADAGFAAGSPPARWVIGTP